nr:polysaccharide biosynthesis tyrosine autokinase [uncultured Desulfobacter sp.]
MLKLKKEIKQEENTLLDQYPAKSGYAESYRTMRTNLQFASMDRDLNAICVTSATEQEGKTNTVANLGYTIAQTGQRVLMVDCDLRKPGLTQRFGKKGEVGLSELVSDHLGTLVAEGSTAEIKLNDLVKLNNLQKRTGILAVSDDENSVELSFLNGSLIDVYWKNRPDSKKLASSLVAANLLTKEQVQVAIGHQRRSVQKLGTILTTMGMITMTELKKYLSMHIVESFKTAASIYNGRFKFTPMNAGQMDTTIEHDVNFEKMFREFLDEGHQFPYLADMIESVVTQTGQENLYIVPSGKIPPNPAEMVSSGKMAFALNHLANVYDFVIIDTPPILPASDALVLAPETDGVLLVVKANQVNRKHIKDAVKHLESAGTKILGVVLNQVDVKRERYYRNYRKYYESYYGEDAKE